LESSRILGHPNARRCRALWISDVHLGTRACRADLLLDFLRHHDADVIYLVGDIVDGWELARSWYWPQSHNDVLQKLLRKARRGAKVIYIPGNHDAGARPFVDLHFAGVLVQSEAVHMTADGRRLWVVHGDAFDATIKYSRFVAWLGGWAYDTAVAANIVVDRIRTTLGFAHWSLAATIKRRWRRAAAYIEAFEQAAVAETRRRNFDGVVCGHIHAAGTKQIDGVWYGNDGDWVENCSALVEHDDGRIETVRWTTPLRPKVAARPGAAPAAVAVSARADAEPPTSVTNGISTIGAAL
jgi:UDP-2,3-diacylglucosamine pyrophosphatase LpxH